MNAVVTTAGRTNEANIEVAISVAKELSLQYVSRKKKSVQLLHAEHKSDVIVVSNERLELYVLGSNTPFFFHPNSAAFRMKRLLKGEKDLFLQATGLQEGDCFLDTTAGLCSDSIVASFATGETGIVHACEANTLVAYIVSTGLKRYKTPISELQNSMHRVHLMNVDAVKYLKSCESDTYDVVYMDPMFEEEIEESSNFQTLRAVGLHDVLTEEWVEQAKRVARKRVVLKAHFRSEMFGRYGFEQLTRLTSKFHYGILNI
ncbi:class I SAM-dependent methyltransferase [Psychrobacillus vulpis]|uniref:Protein-L-IsoD(D-D) O-methyltransferase n=1 Tax=Psychrobacillus vulpis TaxID=2325572 RepID=A0A544TTC7_9BACI|nr:class I SAM-dependent methyltransferase [Psychrobacillus vulpis]TQR20706.1 hypothetical protein FG384_06335 [Psychrobacillus vulpis]